MTTTPSYVIPRRGTPEYRNLLVTAVRGPFDHKLVFALWESNLKGFGIADYMTACMCAIEAAAPDRYRNIDGDPLPERWAHALFTEDAVFHVALAVQQQYTDKGLDSSDAFSRALANSEIARSSMVQWMAVFQESLRDCHQNQGDFSYARIAIIKKGFSLSQYDEAERNLRTMWACLHAHALLTALLVVLGERTLTDYASIEQSARGMLTAGLEI